MFCGQMSSLYVFSEALNQAQIGAMYQLGPGYKVNTNSTGVKHLHFKGLFTLPDTDSHPNSGTDIHPKNGYSSTWEIESR